MAVVGSPPYEASRGLEIQETASHRPTNGEERQWAYDERRTEWLKQQGYEVLRFWTVDVDESLDDVVEAIYLHLSCSADGPIRRFAPPSPRAGK